MATRIEVAHQDPGQRLDRFVHQQCPHLSRTRIQALIKEGAVQVNARLARPSYLVQNGDRIELDEPEPRPLAVGAEEIPLTIVFEDSDLLVIDKPAGMTVHPAPGSWTGTLVNALLHHCRDLSGINGVLRPGIVHRLDKDTSGLLVVAKNDAAHRGLATQLEARCIHRVYTTLVWGHLKEERGRVDAAIGRHPADRQKMAVLAGKRQAITHFAVVERFAFLSLLEVRLETGRTHQIRVHLQHLGHPVFGDPVYGGRNRVHGIRPEFRRQADTLLGMIGRQALHARELRFRHPRSGEQQAFVAAWPEDLARLIEAARNE